MTQGADQFCLFRGDWEGFKLKGSSSLVSIWSAEHVMPPSIERLAEHCARYGIVFGNHDPHDRSPLAGSLLTNVSSLPVVL